MSSPPLLTPVDLIVQVLRELRPHRDLADPLIVLVQSEYCTPELMQILGTMLHQAIATVQDKHKKVKLQDALAKIKMIQLHAKKQLQGDQIEADTILDQFNID